MEKKIYQKSSRHASRSEDDIVGGGHVECSSTLLLQGRGVVSEQGSQRNEKEPRHVIVLRHADNSLLFWLLIAFKAVGYLGKPKV